MGRLSRPLNSDAVKAADDEFYAKHPELVKDGKRIPLSATDPSQADLRKEWVDLYKKHGGQEEDDKKKLPAKKPADPVVPCTKCTVTLSPKDNKLCGAGKTKEITATGTPGGGTYTFSSSDPAVTTVVGNNNKGTITAVARGTAVITVTYTPASCGPCKDTVNVKVCTCTPKSGGGRWYANAKKSVDKAIGVSAKIKTRYGKICCEDEGCSTETGYHVVYVNVSNSSGTVKWAQTGYGRERSAGSTAIKKYRYAEMNGDNYKVNYDTSNAPAEGSVHTYECNLNKDTGKWTFLYDGSAWENYSDNYWKDKTGTDVQWTGEIFNKEDDMPGTAGDKCTFTECKYHREGHAYEGAGLVAGDVGIPSPSHDSNEWGEEWVSGTAFNIWDKKPL